MTLAPLTDVTVSRANERAGEMRRGGEAGTGEGVREDAGEGERLVAGLGDGLGSGDSLAGGGDAEAR